MKTRSKLFTTATLCASLLTGLSQGTSTLTFSADSYYVREEAGPALVTVLRTGDTNGIVTVDYATPTSYWLLFATATAGLDYVAQSGTLAFSPSETNKTISIPILNEAEIEAQEFFAVVLTNPSANSALDISQARVFIEDNDSGFSFISDYSFVDETNGLAVLTVLRSADPPGAVTVDFATTTDGTATAGLDYTPVSGTLTFAAGEKTQTITIPILNDALVEYQEEYFSVVLANPSSGAVVGKGQTRVYIRDDDAANAILCTSPLT